MKNLNHVMSGNASKNCEVFLLSHRNIGLLAKNFLNRWVGWGAIRHKKCCSKSTLLWEFEKTFARLQVARQHTA